MADNEPRIQAVYDCNVFLQGLVNAQSPSNSCLDFWITGDVRLYVSRPILVEIRNVLLRPELQDKFANLTYERVEVLFQAIAQKAVLLEAVPTHFRFERDIKDEPYLNLAIVSGAQYIVSRDNDLLDLMRRPDPVSNASRITYPRISIVDPVAFIEIVSNSPSEK